MTARARSTAADVALASQRLRAQAPLAARLDDAQLTHALCAAARKLSRADDPLGAALRIEARAASGLSPAMIEWCLSTTLATVTEDAIASLIEARGKLPAHPRGLCAVVLAGNVFTVALRAVCLPLIAGRPVLAKAASTDDVFAHCLARALAQSDAELARSYELVRFSRDDEPALAALLAHAEVASVYGDDHSVAEIARAAPPSTRILPHGHGLSAAFMARESLGSEPAAREVAERIAIDIAAYDQRGCLSPHFILVESGGEIDARTFAKLLATHALPRIEQLLPRGDLTAAEKAACLQWRAVAATRGELFATPTHAVSYEPGAPPRPSPGARHISIHDCQTPDDLLTQLTPYLPHLKSLAIAAPPKTRTHLAGHLLPLPLPPTGQLQTPPFTAPQDTHPPLQGLL